LDQDFSVEYDQIPDFNSHEEARTWFKEQFGDDRFLLRVSNRKNGKRIYFYHLVKDPEVYKPYMESFSSQFKHEITNFETFKSYSTIEISEDGEVVFQP